MDAAGWRWFTVDSNEFSAASIALTALPGARRLALVVWMSSVGDVAFVDDFVSERDRRALLEWAHERFREGRIRWKTAHRNYATTKIGDDACPEHERLRQQVLELMDLPDSAIYEGSFIAFHGPGGEVVSHTDGAPPGMAQVRCNVMLEPGEEGGELLIADQRVRLSPGGAWVFFSSDVKHGCSPLRGSTTRVFCAFLFRVPLLELGREVGQRRADAFEAMMRGDRGPSEVLEQLEVEPAELSAWVDRVRRVTALALRPDHERDRMATAEQLRRVSYELREAIGALRELRPVAAPPRWGRIMEQLEQLSQDIYECPVAIGLPAEDDVPAEHLVRV